MTRDDITFRIDFDATRLNQALRAATRAFHNLNKQADRLQIRLNNAPPACGWRHRKGAVKR